MSTYEFKPGEYKQRDGQSATVYEVSDTGRLLGVGTLSDGTRMTITWKSDGSFFCASRTCDTDLMPPKVSGWLNVRKGVITLGVLHPTKAAADAHAAHDRDACVYVEFTPGEGL